ncbi:MAG: glycosyltransferase family 2 protein, partial [Oscillospiraceae bacterium]|nr:glycosyltransferase family 2 protein [Oscillospiraceae bacterium]
MITISVCMIVKDEESVLARCLDCAKKFADEIVIVDTGSTDATVDIAKKYTEKVFRFQWVDDFSAARNYSFSKATTDYIMWLDADDIVDDENVAKLLLLKETLPTETDAVMMRYNTGFDETGRVTMSYFRERLVKRSNHFQWNEPVHEHIVVGGRIIQEEIAVIHGEKERAHSTRNLDIYAKNEANGKYFSSRALFYYARELAAHGNTKKAVECYNEFLDRPDGWIEDRLRARNDLSNCHHILGDDKAAVCSILLGFEEALPRAEACCHLGRLYLQQQDHKRAAFWYEIALISPKPEGWGFTYEDYEAYIPHMQLC